VAEFDNQLTLPLLTLSSGVVLPGMVFTLALETDESRVAVDAARAVGGRLVVVPNIEGRYAKIGVIAEVLEEGELPGGPTAAIVRGDQRAEIGTAVPGTGQALWVQVEPISVGEPTTDAVQLAREYRAVLENILLTRGARRMAERLRSVHDASEIADLAGYSPDLSLEAKVQVLETVDLEERLRLVLGWARETLADLTLRDQIKSSVEEGMEKTQREFLLRRQLEAIRKELGELSDSSADVADPDDYRSRLEALDPHLPESARVAIAKEIDRFERTSEQSPERGWIQTWLDTVFELPWGKESEDRLDIPEAGRILDEDHEGLRDVKDRILEHLAVRKLQTERGMVPVKGARGAGAILALVGPPGVGKTSLGESVARALGRSFVRVSLGGVRDEAEIRGHRRTYVGAQAGRLVRALREAGTMNPVILLDEVDKLGTDFRGDPSSALLEVLDPAQNHTFRDHYLEIELDLSKVLFLTTANVLETIPGPLYDRLEVIRLDGYTDDEKLDIARVADWTNPLGMCQIAWYVRVSPMTPSDQLRKEEARMRSIVRAHDSTARRGRPLLKVAALTVFSAAVVFAMAGTPIAGAVRPTTSPQVHLKARGLMDCNGFSPVQKLLRPMLCTDIRGISGVNNSNTWGGKFYDNGHYIGHDEPDLTFLSNRAGSGNDVTLSETLGKDPSATPTITDPGKDVADWYELTPAPWLSMALCDPYSYPQLQCVPKSNKNAPQCTKAFNCPTNSYPGAGSAVMEMQFYPPGNPPFIDNESCSSTQWCAGLTIDSLECTNLYGTCNTSCEEPVNFAFIQRNGVPTGGPGPGDSDEDTSIPNSETLLMNPGDKVTTHMFDAPAPGGGDAFEVKIDDLTTHQTGVMQASAHNGFQVVNMLCQTETWNWQPEYNTATTQNIAPWAALQTNISTEFETGHFEPCSSVTGSITNPFDPSDTGGTYTTCVGGYEGTGSEGAETSDEICYAANDPHTGFDGVGTSVTGAPIAACQDNVVQNGDLDFDGTPYRTEWPTGAKPTSLYPGSFVESLPTTGGHQYSQFFIQTDVALSESTCTAKTLGGCSVPPAGKEVDQAGHKAFYPYWSEQRSGKTCTWLFGNVSTGSGVNDFGKDAEYGHDLYSVIGYPEFEGKIYNNLCPAKTAT
jgi:hypothetical protein